MYLASFKTNREGNSYMYDTKMKGSFLNVHIYRNFDIVEKVTCEVTETQIQMLDNSDLQANTDQVENTKKNCCIQ